MLDLALGRCAATRLDANAIWRIASDGCTMCEPVAALVARNRGVTSGYAELSRSMAQLIAGGGRLDANWCTFAQWSSRTIGLLIESIETWTVDGDQRLVPRCIGRSRVVDAVLRGKYTGRRLQQTMGRSRDVRFRLLAAGNRAVFLEIGLMFATFLQHFPHRSAAAGAGGRARWDDFWQAANAQLDGLSTLDRTWMFTSHSSVEGLRQGMLGYHAALRSDHAAKRSRHVHAANMLVAAYEQRRVDGYLRAAFAVPIRPAVRDLVATRGKKVLHGHRWGNGLFAHFATRQIALQLPGESLWLHQKVSPPTDPHDAWDDAPAPSTDGRRRATIWTSYQERMNTISELFRLRQRQAALFDAPFTPSATDSRPLPSGLPTHVECVCDHERNDWTGSERMESDGLEFQPGAGGTKGSGSATAAG